MSQGKSKGHKSGGKGRGPAEKAQQGGSDEEFKLTIHPITKKTNWIRWSEKIIDLALEKYGKWMSTCLRERKYVPRQMQHMEFNYSKFIPEDEELEIEEDYEGLTEDEARDRAKEYAIQREAYAKEVKARNKARRNAFNATKDAAEMAFRTKLADEHASICARDQEHATMFCGTILKLLSAESKAVVQCMAGYKSVEYDVVGLFKLLERSHSLQKTKDVEMDKCDKEEQLLLLRQGDHESIAAWKLRFTQTYAEADAMGVKPIENERMVARFIKGLNKKADAYRLRLRQDKAIDGSSSYPASIDDVADTVSDFLSSSYDIMTKDDFKSMYAAMQCGDGGGKSNGNKSSGQKEKKNADKSTGSDKEESTVVDRKPKFNITKVKCHMCKKLGHIMRNCPLMESVDDAIKEAREEAEESLQLEAAKVPESRAKARESTTMLQF